MSQLEAPVALIVFNRPQITRRLFAAVSVARPSRLLLIADGPRADHADEAVRCEEVRQIVTAVDWPCRVETNFAAENIGCRRRVISGIDWVFSLTDEAIILEDDCLPDPSFFPFCAELLERYRHQSQIGYISGFNPLEKSFPFQFSYYYSLKASCWGWATWKRAWKEYDEHIRSWPQVKAAGLLKFILPDRTAVEYWSRIFDSMYQGKGKTVWDYQWVYTCWANNWLNVIPSCNLIQNIGFGGDATHPQPPDPDLTLPARAIQFPLQHPPAITSWPAHVAQVQRRLYTPGILRRIRRKLRLRFGATAREA